MKKKYVIGIIIAVILLVAIAAVSLYAVSQNNKMGNGSMANMSSMSQTSSAGTVDKNSADYKMYAALKGEAYDQTFMTNMIAHHQGAIDMATLALANAKHQEIKNMANDIIAAQTKEISDMQQWQKAWGYQATNGTSTQDSSTMATMNAMTSMTDKLKGLSGDAFDKAFLSSMIDHHQTAINMAYPGQTNAQHEEIKTVTKAIVEAQSKEIAQMKQWQKDWNY